jgi:hypothetical protein
MSNVFLNLAIFINISLPIIIQLIRKDQLVSWGVEVVDVFQFLKVSFTTTPLLIHVDLLNLLSWRHFQL